MTADTGAGVIAGVATEDWSADAQYHEYSRAANPIGSGHTPKVPIQAFLATLHADAPTGVIPLDLSHELGITGGPATSPGLCASFVRIHAGEAVATEVTATSELFFVWRGAGRTVTSAGTLDWGAGDLFVLPGGRASTHTADVDAVLYWVSDEPLLRHLGVAPVADRFRTTRFPAARLASELDAIANAPHALDRNRLSVLLSTEGPAQAQTLTVTHVLWAMYGLLPAGAVQRPHRHQSVALDLIVDCQPGCYSLLGTTLDGDGNIERPIRVDWEPGGAFTTPPGLWHAHVNESGVDAHLLPIQDAGLQTYLRALDIRFAPPVARTPPG